MRTSSPNSSKSPFRNNRCLDKPFRRSSPNQSTDHDEKDFIKMNEINDKNLIDRITWFDVNLVLNELNDTIDKPSINRSALKIKSRIQSNFYDFGHFLQRNAGLILFAGILIFLTTSIGIKSINYENNFENLWVEGKRILIFRFFDLLNIV